MDSFPLTYLKEPSGLMSDPYVLIECEVLMCGPPPLPPTPNTIFLSFLKQNAVGLSFRAGSGLDRPSSCKDLTFSMMVYNDSNRESMKSERCQNHQLRLFFCGG